MAQCWGVRPGFLQIFNTGRPEIGPQYHDIVSEWIAVSRAGEFLNSPDGVLTQDLFKNVQSKFDDFGAKNLDRLHPMIGVLEKLYCAGGGNPGELQPRGRYVAPAIRGITSFEFDMGTDQPIPGAPISSAFPGTLINIVGNNFDRRPDANVATIAGKRVPVVYASPTVLTVMVPLSYPVLPDPPPPDFLTTAYFVGATTVELANQFGATSAAFAVDDIALAPGDAAEFDIFFSNLKEFVGVYARLYQTHSTTSAGMAANDPTGSLGCFIQMLPTYLAQMARSMELSIQLFDATGGATPDAKALFAKMARASGMFDELADLIARGNSGEVDLVVGSGWLNWLCPAAAGAWKLLALWAAGMVGILLLGTVLALLAPPVLGLFLAIALNAILTTQFGWFLVMFANATGGSAIYGLLKVTGAIPTLPPPPPGFTPSGPQPANPFVTPGVGGGG